MTQRLRNKETGVIVEVRDDKVLDGYEPVEEKKTATRTGSKSADKPE